MAALPYMRFYPADYLADAAHLTTIQHGAYFLLLMNYWQRGGPLPDDDVRLAKIARLNKRDWRNNRDAILEFFTKRDNLLCHSRVDRELAHVEAKSLKSKGAAQASVQRRFGERSTDVEPTDTEADKNTLAKANGAVAPQMDPVKQLFDVGVALLTSTGLNEKQARSLIGKYRKGREDSEVLAALIDCRTRAISNPVEWLAKRFQGGRYVSASGYEYRGTIEQVIRESERRADWNIHWQAKRDLEGRAAQ